MATLQLAIQTTKVRQGASEFINATVQVKGAARSVASELGVLNNTMGSTGTIMGAVARTAGTLFAGFAGLQGLREAIKTFAEFEQTLASLQGVTSATATEMQNLKTTALTMGASSRSSANQAAEGLLILSKAGFSSKQAIESLPGVLALATAHQLDLGQASDYTANILNQFGLKTDQTNRVVDILSTTANKSLADVRDLAEAMKYAGPAAGALGIDIEEAAAAAGVLSDRGIKASLAGTNLRGIMVDLVSPTAKARQTLESMGLSIRDVDVRTVGFTGAMKNLAKAGASVEDLAKIFGVMQVSGATALVQHTKRMEQLTEANRKSSGSTKELVDIMQDTLKGRFLELVNVIGVAIIKIGDSGLGKSMKDLLIVITDGVRLLTGFEDKIVGSREAAQRAANVFKILGAILAGMIALKAGTMFVGMAEGLMMSLKASTGLLGAMGSIWGVLVALAALDFGMYLHDEFKIVQQVALEVVTSLNKGWEYLKYGWKVMVAAMSSAWDWLMGFVKVAFGTTVEYLAKGYDQLGRLFENIPGLEDTGTAMRDGAKEMEAWGVQIKETAGIIDMFAIKSFGGLNNVLQKVVQEIDDPEFKRATAHLKNVFGGKTGEKLPVEQLLELNKEVQYILTMIERDRSVQAQVAARRIREEWVKGLSASGAIPFSLRKAMAGGEMDAGLAEAEAVKQARLKEIEAEFQGKDRKGNSYEPGKHLAEQLQPLYEMIQNWMKLGEVAPAALAATEDATNGAAEATEEYQERVRDLTIMNEQAHERVLEMVKAVHDEADALQRSQREKNVMTKVTQFTALAEEAYGKETERTTQAIKDYTEAINRLEDAKADRKFKERIRQVQAEREGLMLSNKERRIAVEVARFQAEAEDAYGKGAAKAAEQTALFADELRQLAEAEELRQLADGIGDAFGQAFTDVIFGAKSAREAIEDLTKSIIQMVFQQLVAKQISSWISGGIMGAFGGGSAKGNLFMGGSIVPFAKGGIVAGPTTFPMSSGRTGLMGENGPEAIMPLSRGSSGKLGVEVSGHASKVLNATVIVQANNPNEFRGSERQMSAKLKAAMQRM